MGGLEDAGGRVVGQLAILASAQVCQGRRPAAQAQPYLAVDLGLSEPLLTLRLTGLVVAHLIVEGGHLK